MQQTRKTKADAGTLPKCIICATPTLGYAICPKCRRRYATSIKLADFENAREAEKKTRKSLGLT